MKDVDLQYLFVEKIYMDQGLVHRLVAFNPLICIVMWKNCIIGSECQNHFEPVSWCPGKSVSWCPSKSFLCKLLSC